MAAETPLPTDSPPPRARTRTWLRLGLLAVLIGGLLLAGHVFEVDQHFTSERLQQLVRDAGPWALPAYLGVFTLGELVHIPGFVFVAVACALFGWLAAYGLALAGAVVSASLSFFIVRGVAGKALDEVGSGWLRRVLDRVDERPITTVVVLRLIFWMAPALNYALALTGIRFRDYVAGTLLGLAVPVLGIVAFFEWLFEQDLAALWAAWWPWLVAAAAALALTAVLVQRWRARA